jgi:2'-5' RNA ligase
MLSLDGETEKTVSDARVEIRQRCSVEMRAVDLWTPHLTLAIFEQVVTPEPDLLMRSLADQARSLSLTFCGLGLFRGHTGFTVFLPVAPSTELLELHRAVHCAFPSEVRRDGFYDVGKWLPHCSVVSGISGLLSVDILFEMFPSELFKHGVQIGQMEMIFVADLMKGPLERLHSIPLR